MLQLSHHGAGELGYLYTNWRWLLLEGIHFLDTSDLPKEKQGRIRQLRPSGKEMWVLAFGSRPLFTAVVRGGDRGRTP